MRLHLLAVVLLAGAAAGVPADEPVAATAATPPAACAVPWSTLSPRNEGLPVVECFQGSLLRLDNSSACGVATGPLWVGSRWVLTSADLNRTANRAATCQQLETGAWAGTRDLNLDCIPQKKGPDAKPAAAAAAPAAGTPPTSGAH